MQCHANSIEPIPTVGLRAARAVVRDRGISDTTLWRWCRRGWIKAVNISGKNYIDVSSLAEFDRRAAAGEFSKPSAGAAGASSAARKKRLAP
jgi:predicted site-specific integrase-resolvase